VLEDDWLVLRHSHNLLLMVCHAVWKYINLLPILLPFSLYLYIVFLLFVFVFLIRILVMFLIGVSNFYHLDYNVQ